MKLLPSIASADPLRLFDALEQTAGWPYLHVDLEDGNFTPNITFGMKTIEAVCREAHHRMLDVHLMASDPLFWLEKMAGLPLWGVAAPIEALAYPMRFLNRAHALGFRAGLAMNLKNSGEETRPFWEMADYLLVMTAEPDNAGEKLYQPALEKALMLSKTLPHGLELYADGGLDEAAVKRLRDAGAAGAVLGRLVFSQGHPVKILSALEEAGTSD